MVLVTNSIIALTDNIEARLGVSATSSKAYTLQTVLLLTDTFLSMSVAGIAVKEATDRHGLTIVQANGTQVQHHVGQIVQQALCMSWYRHCTKASAVVSNELVLPSDSKSVNDCHQCSSNKDRASGVDAGELGLSCFVSCISCTVHAHSNTEPATNLWRLN